MSTTSEAGGGGAGGVLRQGHLRKLKTMKKKFFVLRADGADNSARLEYYESEKKFKAGAAPRRVLPLKSCYNIMRRLDLKQKHVIALFTREEQFCIVAENEQDLHAWLADILKQHCTDDASEELLHPIQHVWQVNVQKKGLGATKNIYGLYNLCLTDKTLTLVKIKSHNNVISELGIPERVVYSLKNIRRCGDSECFFYMEVGRQTTTGAGELWMHSDDSNIAQSMHSTIYHAMRNCAKESENERDHIVIPKNDGTLPARRQTYSDGRGRAGLLNAEYQQNNTLTEKERVIKHHRTVSLPTGCPLFQEPLKICHGRTHSAPLTGDELDKLVDSNTSCVKPVNGLDGKKSSARRASTGMRLSKLSPAHSKNAGTLRNRCDSMPSRTSFEIERPPLRHNDLEGVEVSRDETDAVADWYRTPRIPEEPDLCDISRDLFNMSIRPGGSMSIQHSRTSSMGVEDGNTGPGTGAGGDTSGYLAMEPCGGGGTTTTAASGGYLPMAPGHESLAAAGLLSASSGSVCSGTPSTDPRFSEYTLEPATSHFAPDARPPRAYSVGSRPAPRGEPRHRAYSVGARARPAPAPHHHPRASAEDLMLLDFSNNSPGARTPPTTAPHSIAASYATPRASRPDEYVDMSPRNAGYVEMRPGETPAAAPGPPVPAAPPPPPVADGYVEMSYGRSTSATRPIAIGATRPPPPAAGSPDARRTPLGSQTLFPFSLESPASPPTPTPLADEMPPTMPLATVAEETMRRVPPPLSVTAAAASCSPQYVRLAMREPPSPSPAPTVDDSGAAVVVAGCAGAATRFALPTPTPAPPPPTATSPLNYAALDLEPRRAPQPAAPRTYTQIDFVRSEKLHAADAT